MCSYTLIFLQLQLWSNRFTCFVNYYGTCINYPSININYNVWRVLLTTPESRFTTSVTLFTTTFESTYSDTFSAGTQLSNDENNRVIIFPIQQRPFLLPWMSHLIYHHPKEFKLKEIYNFYLYYSHKSTIQLYIIITL